MNFFLEINRGSFHGTTAASKRLDIKLGEQVANDLKVSDSNLRTAQVKDTRWLRSEAPQEPFSALLLPI